MQNSFKMLKKLTLSLALATTLLLYSCRSPGIQETSRDKDPLTFFSDKSLVLDKKPERLKQSKRSKKKRESLRLLEKKDLIRDKEIDNRDNKFSGCFLVNGRSSLTELVYEPVSLFDFYSSFRKRKEPLYAAPGDYLRGNLRIEDWQRAINPGREERLQLRKFLRYLTREFIEDIKEGDNPIGPTIRYVEDGYVELLKAPLEYFVPEGWALGVEARVNPLTGNFIFGLETRKGFVTIGGGVKKRFDKELGGVIDSKNDLQAEVYF